MSCLHDLKIQINVMIRAFAGRMCAWIIIMLTSLSLSACGIRGMAPHSEKTEETADFSDDGKREWDEASEEDPENGLHKIRTVRPEYAEQFSIDQYEGGYSVININEVGSYLVIDADKAVPEGFSGMTVIRRPADRIYLASSSSMDFFRALDCLDRVALTSTKAGDWSLPAKKRKRIWRLFLKTPGKKRCGGYSERPQTKSLR